MRAIYEWCSDNGYTPYLAVTVDTYTQVPLQFVRDGQIVLNISHGATKGLKMDNESIRFSARFGGVARDIFVPVENVIAIYASENGQGMAFEMPDTQAPRSVPRSETQPALHSVSADREGDDDPSKPPDDTPDPPKGSKPTLTRVK